MTFHLRLAFLTLMVPELMMADVFSYHLILPGVDPTTLLENTGTTWILDFSTQGPFNGSPGALQSLSETGTPAPGFSLIFSLQQFLSVGSDAEVRIVYAKNSNVEVEYIAFATDTFWATPGTPTTFAATNDLSNTDGAFVETFTNGFSAGPTGGYNCDACTVKTTDTPAPELGSMALLATAFGVSGLLLWRRRRKLADQPEFFGSLYFQRKTAGVSFTSFIKWKSRLRVVRGGFMEDRARIFSRLAPVVVLRFTLIFSFVYFAPGIGLRAVAAQSTSPSGSFGFLIGSTFNNPALFPTGIVFLGIMNFDGAGNVAGTYLYEVDTDQQKVPHTTNGAFTGAYTVSGDGSGSTTLSFDNGLSLTLALVIGDGGNSLRLAATGFQFPTAACGCTVPGMILTGSARTGTGPSLGSSYAYGLQILPNAAAEIGVFAFDGAGNATMSGFVLGSTDNNGQPTAPFSISQSGTYTLNPDGAGTIALAAVPGVTNATTWAFLVTNNGSELLITQTDRAGNGVNFGVGRQQ